MAVAQRARVGAELRSLGCRELLTAHLLGGGLHLAPTVDDKVVLGEETVRRLERFEVLASLHESIGDGDLLRAVGKGLSDLPSLPHTWGELVIARFLLSSAACVQLSSGSFDADTGLRDVIDRMLAEERENGVIAEATLRDLFRNRGGRPIAAQANLERWLRVARLLFEEPVLSSGRRAGAGGLDSDDRAGIARVYLSRVAPALSACGLRLPIDDTRAIGTPLPPGALAAS